MAAQGWDLKQNTDRVPDFPARLQRWLRQRVAPLDTDRPLAAEVETLRAAMQRRELPWR